MSAKAKAKIIIISIILLICIIVIFQNLDTIPVQVLFWSFRISQALLLLVVVAAGFVAGLLAASVMAGRYRKRT